MVPHSSPSVPGSGRKRPTCQQCGKPRKGHPRGRCLGPEPFADVPAVLPAQIETEVDDDHLLHCRRCHANFDPSSPTQCIIPHVFVSDRFYEGKDRKRVFLSQCCTWKIYVAQTRDNKWDMDMMETRCHFVGQHSATGLHENEINGVNVFDCWNNGRGVCRRVPIEDEVDSPVWTDNVDKEWKRQLVRDFYRKHKLNSSLDDEYAQVDYPPRKRPRTSHTLHPEQAEPPLFSSNPVPEVNRS